VQPADIHAAVIAGSRRLGRCVTPTKWDTAAVGTERIEADIPPREKFTPVPLIKLCGVPFDLRVAGTVYLC
jgi:hypothetical protein